MPATMDKFGIRIGVVADVVCAWSYIGKRRLEKAMEITSDLYTFQVDYFPFELHPHTPEEGLDYHDYLRRKFGGEDHFVALTSHIRRVAAREGLSFNLHLQHTIPNTRNAHRIIMFAREHGKQEEVVEGFFRAYFTEGVGLTRKENLVAIAEEAGLDAEKTGYLLNSNTGKLEIEMAEKELQDLGITSAPLYIINDRVTISGAQSVETFTRAFHRVAEEEGGSHPEMSSWAEENQTF